MHIEKEARAQHKKGSRKLEHVSLASCSVIGVCLPWADKHHLSGTEGEGGNEDAAEPMNTYRQPAWFSYARSASASMHPLPCRRSAAHLLRYGSLNIEVQKVVPPGPAVLVHVCSTRRGKRGTNGAGCCEGQANVWMVKDAPGGCSQPIGEGPMPPATAAGQHQRATGAVRTCVDRGAARGAPQLELQLHMFASLGIIVQPALHGGQGACFSGLPKARLGVAVTPGQHCRPQVACDGARQKGADAGRPTQQGRLQLPERESWMREPE
jgi:hypothetical protein